MATVKTYSCPICNEPFTAAQIKKNSKRCPKCSVPLKHSFDKSRGRMVHDWIIDDSRQAPVPKQVEEVGPKYEQISPDDDPQVFRLIGENHDPKNVPDFQVVYWDKMSQTHLRCPICNGYLHTTSVVVGWQEDLCRNKVPSGKDDGRWHKCKIRTKFIFLRRGQSHEINV
jgi:hypothetical protein